MSSFAGLEGAVALVTGAATGIGEGVARKLAQAGARLALADIDADGVKALAGDLGASAHPLDVTDGGAVEACVADIEKRLGPIGHLAHVVGIQRFGALVEADQGGEKAEERGLPRPVRAGHPEHLARAEGHGNAAEHGAPAERHAGILEDHVGGHG